MALDVVAARFGGGLSLVDAPEALPENAASVLTNFRLTGAGRLTTRRAMQSLTNTIAGTIVGIFPFTHVSGAGGVILSWDSAAHVVKLYTVDGDGTSATFVDNLAGWTVTGSTRPRITACVIRRVIWFAEETKSHPLTCWDPNDVLGSGATNGMFCPVFNFNISEDLDDDPAAAAMYPRGVCEHNNMLMAFGYGDEVTGDRPELLRWSYIGLEADSEGAGDAGLKDDGETATLTGATSLFDIEDTTTVGERHTPIVAMASGNGRSVIATGTRAFVLFGSDRDSFQLDEIDNQHGCVATRAMVEANGDVYWMSSQGPVRYRGGASVEDLSQPISPRLADIQMATVFAAHSPDEHQVRFYYTPTTADQSEDATRVLIFDYYANAWMEDTLGTGVYCAGSVRQSGAEGPAGAPADLTHTLVASNAAQASWTNGDTSPGVVTKIYRAPDSSGSPGTYVLQASLGSGVSAYGYTGLSAETTYWTKVEHVRNGQTSTSVSGSFTTLAASAVSAPANFVIEDSSYLKGGTWRPSILASFDMGQDGCTTEIEVKIGAGGTFTFWSQVEANGTSFRDDEVSVGTAYYFRIRHRDALGTYSDYTVSSPTSISPTPNF